MLVDHRLAGLWLPPGGHVELGEHPVQTVRREAAEELGLEAELPDDDVPSFLTWTQTVGPDVHTDVSLWFLLQGDRDQPLSWDRREFHGVRWWPLADPRRARAEHFEPHLARFLAKVRG